MKSTPAFRCCSTTSATASRRRSSSTSAFAHTSCGAGNAPTCVVRILSVLRLMSPKLPVGFRGRDRQQPCRWCGGSHRPEPVHGGSRSARRGGGGRPPPRQPGAHIDRGGGGLNKPPGGLCNLGGPPPPRGPLFPFFAATPPGVARTCAGG